jgi:hypothetical protein
MTADPCYRGAFLFLKPSLSDISNIYTLPFSRAVWVTYLVTTAVFCCALHVVQRTEGAIGDSAATRPLSLSDSVLTVIGIVCQEGRSVLLFLLPFLWGGVAVGDAVGVAVGDAVGDAVGVAVGDAVGVAVGDAVGVAVGDAVGFFFDIDIFVNCNWVDTRSQ